MPRLDDSQIAAAARYNHQRPYNPARWRAIQQVVGTVIDGLPGRLTAVAVAAWQRTHGLVEDGMVGPATLAKMGLAREGSGPAPAPERIGRELPGGHWPARLIEPGAGVAHPLPRLEWLWGYHHARTVPGWPQPDGQLEAVTATGTIAAGLVRLVTGYSPQQQTFSRGLDDFMSLDTISIGIPHWWAESAGGPLSVIAREQPDLAAWAWGADRAASLRDPDWLEGELRRVTGRRELRGHHPHHTGLDWLLAGWWAISRHPAVVAIQCRAWLDEYVGRARRVAAGLGWSSELLRTDGARVLAALTRAANSGAASTRRIGRFVRPGLTPLRVLERFYHADRGDGGYGKPRRWAKIVAWPEFDGPAPDQIVVERDLALDVTPRRRDGSRVELPEEAGCG